MFIVRNKNNEIISIASRLQDAVSMAAAAQLDKTDYTVQECSDSVEQRQIYKAYYKTRS